MEDTETAGGRTIRNTALVVGARIISRGLALITVLVMANHLGNDGLGVWGNLINWTALTAVILDLGFNTLYVREGARHPGEISRYLQNVMGSKLIQAIPVFVVLAGALGYQRIQNLLIPGFVLLVVTSYSNLLRATCYALGKLKWETLAIVLESLVLTVLVVAGVLAHQGVVYFIWAYAGSYGFSCFYFFLVLPATGMARPGFKFELTLIRHWLWSGLPFALTFVLTAIYFKIDVPILFSLRGAAETGNYVFAYKPFESLLFIPTAMLNVVFPILGVLHKRDPKNLGPATDRFFKALFLLGWPLTVGTFLLSPALAIWFPRFQAAAPALRILSLAIVFMFVSNAFIGYLNSIDRQSLFTWAAGLSVAVNLVLNLLLIPTWGSLGAAWATVLTEMALAGIGLALVAGSGHLVPVWRLCWRPGLAGLAMGAALVPFGTAPGLRLLGVAALGAVVYLALAWFVGAVDADDRSLIRGALRRPAR
ncbi:MAG TPA: polysaccharide biosynthesis C-terminal domain-containing protein [Candidatus Dormibacteraeota bacterium]|nr:polysaccharide biosynthesis C-terminal domain-containing protein [Candidatus Dormibacteraeota bacterium]